MVTTLLLMMVAGPAAETGTFRYEPAEPQSALPERYRLEARTFDYRQERKFALPNAGVTIDRVTFPSPVESPHVENNTVHAEYYHPAKPGRFPGVIVLDITGGDQSLSRMIATYLAQNDVAALFVQMAYYGPRRPPGSKLRLLSTNIPHSMAAVRQTVFDIRVASAWLASRPNVDPRRVGILGTSLGSFMATLVAETEPRLDRVVLLLGGGGLVDAFYDHPQAKPYRTAYELFGGTKDKVKDLIAPVDPITMADKLKGRNVLMVCASRDEIVPPASSKALWEAMGQPQIIWYDTTHYGAALFIPKLLPIVADYIKAK
jgi:dienelactone hydrolase